MHWDGKQSFLPAVTSDADPLEADLVLSPPRSADIDDVILPQGDAPAHIRGLRP